VPSQQRAAEPCARPTCGSSAYSLSSGRTRTGDTVSANGGNWISGGAGGVCGIWADISLSVTTMARRGRSRRGGGPFHAKSTPARSEKPRPDFAGADVAEKAGEHGAAGIGAGAGPTRQPAMGLWRRHANKARFRFLRGPIIQFNKVSANGRLQKWPPFAKSSLSRSWIGSPAFLVYEEAYRALAGDATIPVDRPNKPEFQRSGPSSCVNGLKVTSLIALRRRGFDWLPRHSGTGFVTDTRFDAKLLADMRNVSGRPKRRSAIIERNSTSGEEQSWQALAGVEPHGPTVEPRSGDRPNFWLTGLRATAPCLEPEGLGHGRQP
jgi:hypothetical protein